MIPPSARPPELCWIALAAKSVLWLFVSVNVGSLFGVTLAAAFGTATLGVHAILLSSLLISVVLVGLCVRKEPGPKVGRRSSTACCAATLQPALGLPGNPPASPDQLDLYGHGALTPCPRDSHAQAGG